VNAKVNQIKIELQKKKEDQKVVSSKATSSEPTPPVTAPACSPQDLEKSLEVEVTSPTRSAKSGET